MDERISRHVSRRNLIAKSLAAVAGVSGLAASGKIAEKFGLAPPDHGVLYGLGETLTYASHRLLGSGALAREFSRSEISKTPFANETSPPSEDFKRLQAAGFSDWKLEIDGLVSNRAALSLSDVKILPRRSQITQVACEEGWSYIAEWIGTPLSEVLRAAGIKSNARYVVYRSMDREWWDSVDMADALHPQTLVTYAMNDGDLPVGFGGPLRLRVPRQLGYKSVKYITHLTVTDDLKRFGKGLGSAAPEGGYAWYAGI